ncbi:MAG: hypothetical protein QXY62_01415 [Candidatus Altiarchaeota archaeon]
MKFTTLPLIFFGVFILANGCVNFYEIATTTTTERTIKTQLTTTSTLYTSLTTTIPTPTVNITTLYTSLTTTIPTPTVNITTTTTNLFISDYVDKGYRELILRIHLFCSSCNSIVNWQLRKNTGIVKFFSDGKVWHIIYNPKNTTVEYITRHIGGYDYEIIEDKELRNEKNL